MLPPPPLRAWSSAHYEVSLPAGHPFPIAKYAHLRDAIVERGILRDEELTASELAPEEWLQSAHDGAYVTRALHGELSREEERRLGLPWSQALVRRARGAVYGTVAAARAALEHGIAGNLAGGTHHAYPDRAEGYCLFNDIAVAIAVLRAEGSVLRPLVVDLDVHQGNGTAVFFAQDESVFTFSMHAASNYPQPKEQSRLDVALPDHCGDEEYLEQLAEHLERVFEEHRADFVFFQAGVDGLEEDRLGRLSLTHDGLARRDEMVFGAAERHGLPITITLGGGYGRPIEASVEAHLNVWRAARSSLARRETFRARAAGADAPS
jgi:acetoin utilization deacetylase AcuC-like enzyme